VHDLIIEKPIAHTCMDIIKCLFIEDWISIVDLLYNEMEAFDCKGMVDT